MRNKDSQMLEEAYKKIVKKKMVKEYTDDDERSYARDEVIMFNDPFDKPYSYEVSYEVRGQAGVWGDDSIDELSINWAKAYEKDVPEGAEEARFLFDVTKETDPNLGTIQDWVYNHVIGDSPLDVL